MKNKQEEPKQEGYICPHTKIQCDDECCVSAEDCHITSSLASGMVDCKEPKQEIELIHGFIPTSFFDKQETLEEAAERLQKDKYGIFISKNAEVKGQLVIDTAKAAFLSGMTEGVKWQAERSYSEEEVGELVYTIIGQYANKVNIMIDGSIIDRLF